MPMLSARNSKASRPACRRNNEDVLIFNGCSGIWVGIAVLIIMWGIAYWRLKKGPFDFDARGEAGTFEKLLTFYNDILKFILGLASGSIVLIVGLRKSEQLPSSFASPLFLLALSIIYGIICMIFLTTNYEGYRHKTAPYTRFKYSRNIAFGYSSFVCFFVGYAWLIFIVTR